MRPRIVPAALLVAVLAALPAPASAQGSGAPTVNATFDAAQKLFDEGRQADAMPLFRVAVKATGSPNARLMLARCLVAMGKTAEAYNEMAITTRDAIARAEQDPRYVRTRDAAASELALLEQRVGKLVIALIDVGGGVSITLDGVVVEAARLGVPIAVEPGTRVVELIRPGEAPMRRAVTIAAGEVKTLALALAVEPSPSPPPPPPPPPPPRGGQVRVAGFGVAGLGVLGMGIFGATHALAAGKFSTLQQACGSKRCTDPKYGDVVDSGKTLEKVSGASLGVGLAGLAGGSLMIALGGPKPAVAAAALEIGPLGAVLRYRRAF